MEHMLLGANSRNKNARKFNAEFQKNGAYSNASTGSYSVHYLAECADFEWERIIDLMTLSIARPLFLESEFKAEFGNVESEMSGRLNNHFLQLSLQMQHKFGMHVLPDNQRLKQMKNITVDDIRDHYQRTHGTNNIRFIIAGRIRGRKAPILEMLENGLKMKQGTRFELPDEQPKKMKNVHYIHNDTVDNLYFFFDTFASERLNQGERDALSLLDVMLTATLHSLILGEARERGLVYHVGSHHSTYKNAVGWWFGAQVTKTNAVELFDIIIEQIQRVLKGHVRQSDIDDAKQYMLGRYQRGAQTVNGLASGYSDEYFFDETVESRERIPQRIKAIEKAKMIDVARHMFREDIWGLGVLGSCGPEFSQQLADQLATMWRDQ
jgi:predicted Zn-dependent peptidase